MIEKAKELNKIVKAKTAKIGNSSPLSKEACSIKEVGGPFIEKEEEIVEACEEIHGLNPRKPNGNNIIYYDASHEAKEDKD